MAACPAIIELQEAQDTSLTVGSIVVDRPLRNYFGALASHYSGLLSETTRDARLAEEIGQPIYLIDADVVRNYAQVRYKDSRLLRESAQLFENSDFKYALPLGAFYEIVEWLRSFVPNRIMWTEDSVASKNLSRDETIRELAQAFDVSSDETDPFSLMERIVSLVGSHQPVIERLTDLLSRTNFRGVVGDFDLVDVAQLHRILGLMQRELGAPESRVKRDYRDAVNLAVVCKSSRFRAPESEDVVTQSPSYLLVTQTQVLLDLVRTLHNSDEDSLHTLSSLLGLKHPVLDRFYPVLSPRRAFIVEDVRRRYGFRRATFTNLARERKVYEDLGDALDSIGDENEPRSLEDVPADLSHILRERLEHLVKLYYDGDAFYRGLERSRATEASLRYLESRYRSARPPRKKEIAKLRRETESFFKVLNRLHVRLNEMAGTSYCLKRSLDESGTFETLALYSERPAELVLEGEVYLKHPSQDEGHFAYSLRWPTSCTEQQFFSAVSSIIMLPKQSLSERKTLKFECLSPTDEFPHGIVVFTNAGIYASSFDRFPRRSTLKHLSLDDLLQSVLLARANGNCSGKTDTDDEVVLQAVRISTPFADFQLDLSTNSFGGREVFVISHCNIGEQIAHLCECTCLFAVFPHRLNAVLQGVSGKFPRYENATLPGGTA